MVITIPSFKKGKTNTDGMNLMIIMFPNSMSIVSHNKHLDLVDKKRGTEIKMHTFLFTIERINLSKSKSKSKRKSKRTCRMDKFRNMRILNA